MIFKVKFTVSLLKLFINLLSFSFTELQFMVLTRWPLPKDRLRGSSIKKTNNVVAECTICKNSVKYHGSTSNLMEH